MTLHGFYTNKGRTLAAKIAAGTAEMTVTRVVAGSGHTADIPSATDLPEQQQTLSVGLPAVSGSTATLPITLLEVQAAASYLLTELGVYAQDDGDEILFQVYQLDEAEAVTASGEGVLRFYLRQSIGASGVSVTCSPAGVVLEEDIAQLRVAAASATHPNLLDNPWFTVNQRGATAYTVGAYGVDRWKLISGSASVTENGILLNGTLRQIREVPIGAAATASVKLHSGTATVSYSDTTKQFDIVSGGGIIRAVKLELGAVSTLENDAAPNYAQELAKCQRYFQRHHENVYAPVLIENVSVSTYATTVVFPEMRVAPTLSFFEGGKFAYYDLNGVWTDLGTGSGWTVYRKDSITLVYSVPSGVAGTAKDNVFLSNFDLSADL